MFNYDELTVTLSVTPEISAPMFDNYYTKQEADDRFVEEAPQTPEGAIYGRKYKQWENIGLPEDKIYAGYSLVDEPKYLDTDSMEEFVLENGKTQITFSDENESNQNRLWVVSPYPLSSMTITNTGLPVPYEDMGVIRVPNPMLEVSMHCYRTGRLMTGNYSFVLTFTKE